MYCTISGKITSVNGNSFSPGVESYALYEFNKMLGKLKERKVSNIKSDYGEGMFSSLAVFDNGIACLVASDGVDTARFYTVVNHKTELSFEKQFGDCSTRAIQAGRLNQSFIK